MNIPVRIPPHDGDQVVVAKFSGGRSSALACKAAVEQGVADHVVFNNTGLESPETYEFIAACNEQFFGGRLVMLEYHYNAAPSVITDPADLNRTGAPMTELVETNRLPTIFTRICTGQLKVETTHRWLHDQIDYRKVKIFSIVGFRADEPRRIARLRAAADAIAVREQADKPYLKWTDEQVAPLADAGLTRDGVLRAYKSNPLRGLSFDPSNPDVRLSNCVGCFFSNIPEQIRVAQQQPWFADYWDDLERGRHAARDVPPQPRDIVVKLLAKEGDAPIDDYERTAFTSNKIPWSAIKRIAAKRKHIPIQPSMLHAGGCDDGECGLDI